MAQAVFRARGYSWKRHALGVPLAASPLHAATLDDVEADAAGALAFVMEVAALLGRTEAGVASDDERRRLRALIPLAKLTTGKQVVACVSECIEAFGGAGYIEDTGLPRMLRDAQVLPIWEGTTNVLALDVLRAELKDGSFSAIVDDLVVRSGALSSALPTDALAVVRDTVARLGTRARALVADPPALEANARRLAWTAGLCLEAVLLGEVATKDDAAHRFACFVRHRLAGVLGSSGGQLR
jgi:hypothetical protein